ncbi:hypothetical protein FHG87_006422 [Trinorchestia longiramus]|nr:hypothetical protein FHG87_006422 [Trinorchestia longiramus]
MIHIVALFSCILLAAAGFSAASDDADAPFSIRSDVRPTIQDFVGPSLPEDTEYVRISTSTYPLALSIVNVAIISVNTLRKCFTEAKSRGGNVFEFKRDTEKCHIASLQFPICANHTGVVDVYIQPEFISYGTSDDGVTVEELNKGVLLWSILSKPEDDYRTFRVQDPAIFNYPELMQTSNATSLQTIFTEGDRTLVEVDANILVDPFCYTKSACGVPFIYPRSPVKQTFSYLSDYCGRRLSVPSGEEVYLLSHEGIGCTPFPDIGFNRTGCRVNYRGSGGSPLKITMTYFNFVGDDKCDGFYLSVLAFYDADNWTVTKLCDDPVTEITAANPRGRIDFGGTSRSSRQKYGFVIKLSYE